MMCDSPSLEKKNQAVRISPKKPKNNCNLQTMRQFKTANTYTHWNKHTKNRSQYINNATIAFAMKYVCVVCEWMAQARRRFHVIFSFPNPYWCDIYATYFILECFCVGICDNDGPPHKAQALCFSLCLTISAVAIYFLTIYCILLLIAFRFFSSSFSEHTYA